MVIKNIRLGRAEKLTAETRKKHNLPEEGLVVIETNFPSLQENIVPIGEGGIRGYLLSLGNFKKVNV